jgi:hypothetical protein
MDWKHVAVHARDLFVAALGVALMQFLIALMTYLGSHIPDFVKFLMDMSSATAAIKITNYKC